MSCNGTYQQQMYIRYRYEHTDRNFFNSLPDAISRKTAKARLISILSAAAICTTGSWGIWNSGIRGGRLNDQSEVSTNWTKGGNLKQSNNCNHNSLTCWWRWMHWTTRTDPQEPESRCGKPESANGIQAIQTEPIKQLRQRALLLIPSCSSTRKHRQLSHKKIDQINIVDP